METPRTLFIRIPQQSAQQGALLHPIHQVTSTRLIDEDSKLYRPAAQRTGYGALGTLSFQLASSSSALVQVRFLAGMFVGERTSPTGILDQE